VDVCCLYLYYLYGCSCFVLSGGGKIPFILFVGVKNLSYNII
jgi:hypothetical protein